MKLTKFQFTVEKEIYDLDNGKFMTVMKASAWVDGVQYNRTIVNPEVAPFETEIDFLMRMAADEFKLALKEEHDRRSRT